jgi:adenosylmethionine-8-amino-7-oxononanoate aminotransferase
MDHLHWTQPKRRDGNRASEVLRDQIIAARRCTLQLSNGFLYLDAIASPATALLGHDAPPPPSVVADEPGVKVSLELLAAPYRCVALSATADAVAALAREIATQFPATTIVDERTATACRGWWAGNSSDSTIDVIVLRETLSAGASFGALLAREYLADAAASIASRMNVAPPSAAILDRVAGVLQWVHEERLFESAARTMDYLRERLTSVETVARQIASIEYDAISARLAFARPTNAATLKRKMCERGVLVGTDAKRLVITPSLALRPAEIDVVTGALRAALNDLPTWRMPVCCAACEAGLGRGGKSARKR